MRKKIKWTKPLLRPVDGLKNAREGVKFDCMDGSADATLCSSGASYSDCSGYGYTYTPPPAPCTSYGYSASTCGAGYGGA